LFAVFVLYRKPREYETTEADTRAADAVVGPLNLRHYVTILAIIVVVVVQIISKDLSLSSLAGLATMIIFGAIKWNDIDKQLTGGVKLMGLIAFVMLIAGGYANVIQATGGVEELVHLGVASMGQNKLVAAFVITIIGLLVTMGIGTSFGTVPILAVLFVPLCQSIGFSTPATILLMSSAAALGDAGSPASDTTLGPTSGLNADGQHSHIWDTCVPTFLIFNIPLMAAGIVISQFI
ncbi:sodium:proton antiporter, partial [Bifidobacteriaceae bacterium NR020]